MPELDESKNVAGDKRNLNEKLNVWKEYVLTVIKQEYLGSHYFIKEAELFLEMNSAYLQNKQILEAGSGTGLVGCLLASYGANVILLDYSLEEIKKYKKHVKALKITGIEWVRGDIFHIPFISNNFDVVWNEGVIEHFRNPERVLSEMIEVAKKQGCVLVMAPNKLTLHTIFFRPLKRRLGIFYQDIWGTESSYSPNNLGNMLLAIGLKQVKISANNLSRNFIDDFLLGYLARLPLYSKAVDPALRKMFDKLENVFNLRFLGFISAASGIKIMELAENCPT
jgi:2-polyprenyl-3-methyl-5-hydroxy-6-metoxy-1,4-benzoquinol methylase